MRQKPKPTNLVAVAAFHGQSVWLLRRDTGLFGGLWGPPMGRGRPADVLTASGVAARLSAVPYGRMTHILSHRRLDVEVWHATAARAETSARRKLVPLAALTELGISKLTQRILEIARRAGDS